MDDGKIREGIVCLGEEFIWLVYNIIKDSLYWDDILFIIIYDEYGGCYDYVYFKKVVLLDFLKFG